MKIKNIIIIIPLLLLIPNISAIAYVMNSDNYRLEKDSINIGGIEDSSSANYNLRDTIGEIGTGESQSDNYFMKAGYRQMDEEYLSLTAPGTINLSPSIGGVSGGTASGNGTWTVKTDALAGYSLSVKATTSPALHSGSYTFSDYTPAGAGIPDYDWDLAGANSEFGFSPYSDSQIAKYKNDGADCNAGSNITNEKCWYGLTTSYEQIVNKTTRTEVSGEDTTINFQAEVSGFQEAGDYLATIVVTAVTN